MCMVCLLGFSGSPWFWKSSKSILTGIIKCQPFWGNQTLQMYGMKLVPCLGWCHIRCPCFLITKSSPGAEERDGEEVRSAEAYQYLGQVLLPATFRIFCLDRKRNTKINRSHPNARLSWWFSFSESGICYKVHEMYALYLQNIQCHSGQIVRWIVHRIWWGVLTSEYSHKDNGLYSMALCKHVETLMHRYSSLYAWPAFSSVLQICFCMDFSKCLRLHCKT